MGTNQAKRDAGLWGGHEQVRERHERKRKGRRFVSAQRGAGAGSRRLDVLEMSNC